LIIPCLIYLLVVGLWGLYLIWTPDQPEGKVDE
jgi:hypothetical protein